MKGTRAMKFTVPVDGGDPLEFECADNVVSRRVCEDILRGRTYPYLDFLGDVNVVLDVGANCGATTVYLAHHYPNANVYAFEPGSVARAIAERNTANLPNVRVFPIGLYSRDMRTPLYYSEGDLGMASIRQRADRPGESEDVEVRDAASWATEHFIDHIDVLKLDVEGVEVDVLVSLRDFVPALKALYLEYDSRTARREIAALVEDTHDLYKGALLLDQGEIVYVRRDLAELPAATEQLRRMLGTSMREQL